MAEEVKQVALIIYEWQIIPMTHVIIFIYSAHSDFQAFLARHCVYMHRVEKRKLLFFEMMMFQSKKENSNDLDTRSAPSLR